MRINNTDVSQKPSIQAQQHRAQIEQWLYEKHDIATHALTLTFDPKKIWAYYSVGDRPSTLQDASVVTRYQRSMRAFRHKLDAKLYGNKSRRFGEQLLLIPVLEGMQFGSVPHYHCVLGVTPDRFAVVDDVVRDCWSKVAFCGHQVNVERYRDRGFLDYISKEALFLDRPNVDWMNVLVPMRSTSSAD